MDCPPGSDGSGVVVRHYQEFTARLGTVECLLGYEGSDFSSAGDPRESLLGITAAHPMRADAVLRLLNRAGATWGLVEELMRDGSLHETQYAGHRYYLRNPRRDGTGHGNSASS